MVSSCTEHCGGTACIGPCLVHTIIFEEYVSVYLEDARAAPEPPVVPVSPVKPVPPVLPALTAHQSQVRIIPS